MSDFTTSPFTTSPFTTNPWDENPFSDSTPAGGTIDDTLDDPIKDSTGENITE